MTQGLKRNTTIIIKEAVKELMTGYELAAVVSVAIVAIVLFIYVLVVHD